MAEGEYCGGVDIRYSVTDSSANLVTPGWLEWDPATFTFTVKDTTTVGDIGTYDVEVVQYLHYFSNIESAPAYFKINLVPCNVDSIVFDSARASFVMYTDDNDYNDLTFPTWTSTPDCGYTSSLSLSGLASPFSLTGTWTIAEVADRTKAGSSSTLDWTVTLDAPCTGVCTATFSDESIELHDLCETTSFSAGYGTAPTDMSVVAGSATDSTQTIEKLNDEISNNKGQSDSAYCNGVEFSY